MFVTAAVELLCARMKSRCCYC